MSQPMTSGYGRAGGLLYRSAEILIFAVIPTVLVTAFTLGTARNHPAYDFRATWQAGRDILAHRSPYPTLSGLGNPSDAIDAYVYPPLVALLALPVAVLPFGVAAALMVVGGIVATGLAMYWLDVRDWRCYGAVAASACALDAWRLGALTPLLLLGLAAAWRWRNRRRVVILLVALVVVAKVFLAPVVLWIVAERRFGIAWRAGITTACLALGSWAVIGFAGITSYPGLLSHLSSLESAKSYSVVALANSASMPPVTATIITALVAVLIVGACAWAAIRRRLDERLAFGAAVVLSLVLTPILWLHYLLLLVVPIALSKKRMGAPWMLILMTWASPVPESGGSLWRIGLMLVSVLASLIYLQAKISLSNDAVGRPELVDLVETEA